MAETLGRASHRAGDRVWELTRWLGAAREAQRLGAPVVDTGHLLLASLTDPGVRRAVLTAGYDLHDVRCAVSGTDHDKGSARGPDVLDVTPEAAILVIRVAAASPELEPGPPDDVRSLSRALRRLMVELLICPWDSAARRTLTETDLIGHAPRLIATIEAITT